MFIAVCVGCVYPFMFVAEMLFTRNVASDPPPDFPVLAQSSKGRFVIATLRDMPGQSHLVLEIRDGDLDRINADLNSRISRHHSMYPYFRVVDKGDGHVDVSLEVPTKSDFWFKSWYRIQGGGVHPQQILRYGPHMAFFVGPLCLLAAVFAVRGYNRIARGRGQTRVPYRRLP